MRTAVVDRHAQHDQMRQIGNRDWRQAAFAQESGEVALEILVVDAVLNIEGQQVLDLHRRPQAERDARVRPARAH